MKIELLHHAPKDGNLAIVVGAPSQAREWLNEDEYAFLERRLADKQKVVLINQYTRVLVFAHLPETPADYYRAERFRCLGNDLLATLKTEKIAQFSLISLLTEGADTLALAEGMVLGAYQFEKYKSKKNDVFYETLAIAAPHLSNEATDELEELCEAVYHTRDLVNEPHRYQSANQFSAAMTALGAAAGFKVEVLDKEQITQLGMTGLLAVNQGSVAPPTFNILTHQPENALNEKPIVLVGKGVVYDTGGISLKTPNDYLLDMKCDMAGAAAVVGTLYALAKNKIPLYVVGLIPSTDNRPGENALVPGDILRMMNGKTVEVRNTDAEGRLILADALCYASRYEPELVIDLATLTGSAMRAIGYEAAVLVGNAATETRQRLLESGETVFERLAALPFWEEYEDHIKSDIADINNLGRAEAGSITAGRFLQHFTSYPWLHIDLAAPAFLPATNQYRPKGATGYGVRLLYHFLKHWGK